MRPRRCLLEICCRRRATCDEARQRSVPRSPKSAKNIVIENLLDPPCHTPEGLILSSVWRIETEKCRDNEGFQSSRTNLKSRYRQSAQQVGSTDISAIIMEGMTLAG